MRYFVFLIQCAIVIGVGGYLNEAHWKDTGEFVVGPALLLGFMAAYALTVGPLKAFELFRWLARKIRTLKQRRRLDRRTLVLRADEQDVAKVVHVARDRLR